MKLALQFHPSIMIAHEAVSLTATGEISSVVVTTAEAENDHDAMVGSGGHENYQVVNG